MTDIDRIMLIAQLASALEASGTPKPGNVHRNADFHQTSFEHFLAGSIALGPAVSIASLRGLKAVLGEIRFSEIGIGRIIRRAVLDVKSFHRGGNTHLGIAMFFIPLAAAAGAASTSDDDVNLKLLQRYLKRIIKSTCVNDALELQKTISIYDSKWLGKVKFKSTPDLSEDNAIKAINSSGTTFYDLMVISSKWDGVAHELSSGLKTAFTMGYPEFKSTFEKTGDLNTATVNTFLKILSNTPDTFIARKIGLEKTNNIVEAVKIGMNESKKVSLRAKRILDNYSGMITEEGRIEISRFDAELRGKGGSMNPGTTADITAASIMIALLSGLRF
ncbi:MAG TPA: triphosphoribosyl-dephospho-CoA synthase [Nitrososphaerales archaeon]